MFYPEFPDEIAELCYKRFNQLPKKGKPQFHKEWTLLAGVVMSTDISKPSKSSKVVSLSTGTKCLGYSQLSEKGDLIFDSHAEVLARRGLIRFIYHHMHLVLLKKSSDVIYFDETQGKFCLKLGISFHLFVSHIPCGDSAIFPKSSPVSQSVLLEGESGNDEGERNPKKLKTETTNEVNLNRRRCHTSSSTSVLQNDIYRTGAKCVEDGIQDPKGEGDNFHVIGVLRTKPGRGDPTWSMSCSDKLALWNVCGLQGALLSCLLTHPIYIASLTIGQCPFDSKAVQRATIDRLSSVSCLPPHYRTNKPLIFQSSLIFEFSKENVMKKNSTAVPCPASIIWCYIPEFLEVCVNGRKQGITKKNIDKPSSRISVCKSMLLEKFLEITELLHRTESKVTSGNGETYLDHKLKAKPYQEAKGSVFKIFNTWKRKSDHLQKFTILVKN